MALLAILEQWRGNLVIPKIMDENRESMNEAIKEIVIPELRVRGFKGS